jgi:hypothetical protein
VVIGGSRRPVSPTAWRPGTVPATDPGSSAPRRRAFTDIEVGTARLLAAPPVAPPRGTPQASPGTPLAAPPVPPSARSTSALLGDASPGRSDADGSGSLAPARPASLLTMAPPSLFARARAELGGASGATPVAGQGARQASLSVTGATGGTDVTEPEQRAEPVPLADQLSWQEWNQLVDIVVDRLEQRVVDELARRGRRFTPGVF